MSLRKTNAHNALFWQDFRAFVAPSFFQEAGR